MALLDQLNRQLAGGRGAVAGIARLAGGEISYGGIGNIGARLAGHGLVSSMGTLGLGQRLRPQATAAPWRAHSLFAAHSDGIRSSWDLSRYPGVTRHDPAVMAALIWRDAATRADDAAVVIAAGGGRSGRGCPLMPDEYLFQARTRGPQDGPAHDLAHDPAQICANLATSLTTLEAGPEERNHAVAALWSRLRDGALGPGRLPAGPRRRSSRGRADRRRRGSGRGPAAHQLPVHVVP